jgi:hypothetical protein
MIMEETVKPGDIARAVRFGSPVHEIAKQLSRSCPEYVGLEARGALDQLWGTTNELDAGAILGALITYYIALGVCIGQSIGSPEHPKSNGEGARVSGVGPVKGEFVIRDLPEDAER